jgi:orotate phosphoribosyltransferase-like protein
VFKDDVRQSAVELRRKGWSVNDIAVELGVARSTAWLWVKHLPLVIKVPQGRELYWTIEGIMSAVCGSLVDLPPPRPPVER